MSCISVPTSFTALFLAWLALSPVNGGRSAHWCSVAEAGCCSPEMIRVTPRGTAQPPPCDPRIARIHAAMPLSAIVASAEPLLLQGEAARALRTAKDLDTFRVATERRALLAHGALADSTVILSEAVEHSHAKIRNRTLRWYVEQLAAVDPTQAGSSSFYLFGDTPEGIARHLLAPHYPIPFGLSDSWDQEVHASLSFGIGACGSGTPLHVHSQVLAEVFHGRKRWFFAPPGPAPQHAPTVTSLAWLASGGLAASPDLWDCTIEPGDLIFIPDNWWHATLNEGEAVFVSTFI